MPTRNTARDVLGTVSIAAPDPSWPDHFRTERTRLFAFIGQLAADLEHFGSTAVPNLKAKPIIDMMAPINALPVSDELAHSLSKAGYAAVDAGFSKRAFYRFAGRDTRPACHLHLVVAPSWPLKNELILRDWLIANPTLARQYETLKIDLARQFGDDMPRYTEGKGIFLRAAVDQARSAMGLAPETDWNE